MRKLSSKQKKILDNLVNQGIRNVMDIPDNVWTDIEKDNDYECLHTDAERYLNDKYLEKNRKNSNW